MVAATAAAACWLSRHAATNRNTNLLALQRAIEQATVDGDCGHNLPRTNDQQVEATAAACGRGLDQVVRLRSRRFARKRDEARPHA